MAHAISANREYRPALLRPYTQATRGGDEEISGIPGTILRDQRSRASIGAAARTDCGSESKPSRNFTRPDAPDALDAVNDERIPSLRAPGTRLRSTCP